jgi:biotin carboxyl carrier protein
VAEGTPLPRRSSGVDAQLGDAVSSGTVHVVLEAMKTEHPVRGPHAGVVSELGVSAGPAVEMGTVLAVVDATTDCAGGYPA